MAGLDRLQRGNPGCGGPAESGRLDEQEGAGASQGVLEAGRVLPRHGRMRQLKTSLPEHVLVQVVGIEGSSPAQSPFDAREKIPRGALPLPARQGIPGEQKERPHGDEQADRHNPGRAAAREEPEPDARERDGRHPRGLGGRDLAIGRRRKQRDGDGRQGDDRELEPENPRHVRA